MFIYIHKDKTLVNTVFLLSSCHGFHGMSHWEVSPVACGWKDISQYLLVMHGMFTRKVNRTTISVNAWFHTCVLMTHTCTHTCMHTHTFTELKKKSSTYKLHVKVFRELAEDVISKVLDDIPWRLAPTSGHPWQCQQDAIEQLSNTTCSTN